MTEAIDPLLCPDDHALTHRWIRSWITGDAKFCYWCKATPDDVTPNDA